MKKSVFLFAVFFLWTVVCGLWTGYGAPAAEAAVPRLINYQGRLTDASGQPLTGSHDITFRIYDGEAAGNLLWEETHAGVVVDKGLFVVILGSVANLNIPFDKPYFLEIVVGSETMSPRQRLASAGYALRAEDVDSLPKGAIILWSGALGSIPAGWVLCDGNNGTPNLSGRFILGVASGENPGETGGSSAHHHTAAAGAASQKVWVDDASGGNDYWVSQDGHTHQVTVDPATVLPPYYKLAYIMKIK